MLTGVPKHEPPSHLPPHNFSVGRSFSTKEQASFNFMVAITVYSEFGAQENKVSHCFYIFPIYLPWSDETGCHDLLFLNVEF